MAADRYTARGNNRLKMTPEQADFLRRRTMPFLDASGMDTRSLLHLLQEAYLQGIRDAVETLLAVPHPHMKEGR